MIRYNKQQNGEPLPVLGENESSNNSTLKIEDQNRRGPPPRSNSQLSNRRTPTPTKQVALTAVQRRNDRHSVKYEEKVDLNELKESLSRENSRIYEARETETMINGANSQQPRRHRCEYHESDPGPPVVQKKTIPKSKVPAPVNAEVKEENKKSIAEGGKGEDSSSDDSDEEEEPRRAPSELLMEFLDCLMKKEYTVAAKLCRMILIYEPDHATALQFQPVLEEKIKIEQEKENESESDESGNEDSDDSDDSEDDDDDSEDSQSSDEENEGVNNLPDNISSDDDNYKQDSGIASASSD